MELPVKASGYLASQMDEASDYLAAQIRFG